jgi:predicted PurR-regulated permease PerM
MPEMPTQAQAGPVAPPAEMLPASRRFGGRNRAETIIATGVVLTLCYVAKLVLATVLLAILLAFMLAPIRDFFQSFRLPRSVSSLIAVGLLLAVTYGLTYYSYARAVTFLQDLPKYSARIRDALMRVRKQAEDLQRTTEDVLASGSAEKGTLAASPAPRWLDSLGGKFGSVSQVLLSVSFVPFLVYFMLTWQHHVRSATVMLFPMEHRHTAYVTLGLIAAMIRSFMVGNFLIGLLVSVLSTAVFAALQLPFFYFVGILSGFLSLVPYMGVVLALFPPLIVGIGQISSEKALVIVLTVCVLHLFAMNVLYPLLLGTRLQLNPLAVTLALLFWGWMWGGVGLVLAIPITGAMKIIFDHVESLRPYGVWLGE